jgi:hypothetical protein
VIERTDRRERPWGGIALAAVVAAAVACGGGGGPTEARPGSERLNLAVSVSTNEFVRGDSAVIVVSLRNVSIERVRVYFETVCTIVYGIRRAGDGVIVEPAGGTWTCAPFENHIDLDPDQITQKVYVWKGVGIPEGDYEIFGVLGNTMDETTAPVAVRLVDE